MTTKNLKNIPAEGLDEGWKDVFGKIGTKLGNAGAAFPGMFRAAGKAYPKAKAAIGGGFKDVNQIAQVVSMLDKDQAKAVVDYIDNVILKQRAPKEAPPGPELSSPPGINPVTGKAFTKEELAEGMLDDIVGSNRMSPFGYNKEAAVKAQFEKNFAEKFLNRFNQAYRSGSVDLGKTGVAAAGAGAQAGAQAGTQAAAGAGRPTTNILRNSVFVRSLEALKDDELELVRNVAARIAGVGAAAQPAAQAGQAQVGQSQAGQSQAGQAQAGQAQAGTASGDQKTNAAANRARLEKDVQTINNAIKGITQAIKPNLLPNQKAMLARELVNVMADNKKARPEAWQNAYATVKKVLQNVGGQVDATMPKGRQNVTKDLIAALNAGQTRDQQATGISKAQAKEPGQKLAKSSTAARLGKAAPAQRTAAGGATNRRVAESKLIDNVQVYFLNKFLAELDLTWKDIGYVLLETKSPKNFVLTDSKVFEYEKLLEFHLRETSNYNPEGYSPSEFMYKFIQNQLSPINLDSPNQSENKMMVVNNLKKWEDALTDQIEKQGTYKGKFDSATEAAFERILAVVSDIALENYKGSSGSSYGRSSIFDL